MTPPFKLTGKYAFGYIEQSKPGMENIIKVMLKALGLHSEPLVSNIVLIQSPKSELLVSMQYKTNPERKGDPLVSNIGLIQSPNGEPLILKQ